jgi:transcriptional regulator with XRE-family HTH domain
MAGRSLCTSKDGIAQAKRALLRKNLTQKAIANELGIASWSTVNKFFNSKPVDRLLFIEICHALDLDWTLVVATPELEDEAALVSSTVASTGDSKSFSAEQRAIATVAVTGDGLQTLLAVRPDAQGTVALDTRTESF